MKDSGGCKERAGSVPPMSALGGSLGLKSSGMSQPSISYRERQDWNLPRAPKVLGLPPPLGTGVNIWRFNLFFLEFVHYSRLVKQWSWSLRRPVTFWELLVLPLVHIVYLQRRKKKLWTNWISTKNSVPFVEDIDPNLTQHGVTGRKFWRSGSSFKVMVGI